jgi:hypothetical protein
MMKLEPSILTSGPLALVGAGGFFYRFTAVVAILTVAGPERRGAGS